MEEIVKILLDNNGCIDFAESLTVKMTPHSLPEKIVSVWMQNENVFYTTKEGNNKALFPNNQAIVNSILQRLKLLRNIKKEIL